MNKEIYPFCKHKKSIKLIDLVSNPADFPMHAIYYCSKCRKVFISLVVYDFGKGDKFLMVVVPYFAMEVEGNG